VRLAACEIVTRQAVFRNCCRLRIVSQALQQSATLIASIDSGLAERFSRLVPVRQTFWTGT
jgi:hypothetical protein